MAGKVIDLVGLDDILSSQTSAIDEEEMTRMEDSAVPESTSKSTKAGVKKFKDWLRKREIEVNFHSITAAELTPILRRFYAEVKKADGKALTPSSFVGIRAALNRHSCCTLLLANEHCCRCRIHDSE